MFEVDARNKYSFCSYYITGIRSFCEDRKIKMVWKVFSDVQTESESEFGRCLLFKFEGKKYVVDFYDYSDVNKTLYAWADTYAKINANFEKFGSNNPDYKVIPIGPGFGIRGSNFFQSVTLAFLNWLKCKSNGGGIGVSSVRFFRDYIGNWYNKRDLSVFLQDVKVREDYIFSSATLWDHENCITGTNKLRQYFMSKCKNDENIIFEGGFRGYHSLSDRVDHPQYEEFKDILDPIRWTHDDYILKTKQSVLVFNTPSVRNCHGWKLGESLALGKAIISTPFENDLPEALVHGENIHFIKNTDELKDAMKLIANDRVYRQRLEHGARAYFMKYLEPKIVIERIISA